MARSAVKVRRTQPTQLAETSHPLTHRLLRRLRSELNQAFDLFSGQLEPSSLHPLHRIADLERRLRHGMPLGSVAGAVDLVEEDKLFRIGVELPGVDAKDIDVSIADNTLTIKAQKNNEREEQARSYYLREREFGSFVRSIEIPAGVEPDRIDAEFANGVLIMELPKTPEAARTHRKIPVRGR